MTKRTKRPRDKRTGRFVPNENTPFASSGQGIPGGWTPSHLQKKPSKAKATKLPKVISVTHPVDPLAGTKNRQAVSELAEKARKKGLPIVSRKLLDLAAAEKSLMAREARKQKKKRKEKKNG